MRGPHLIRGRVQTRSGKAVSFRHLFHTPSHTASALLSRCRDPASAPPPVLALPKTTLMPTPSPSLDPTLQTRQIPSAPRDIPPRSPSLRGSYSAGHLNLPISHRTFELYPPSHHLVEVPPRPRLRQYRDRDRAIRSIMDHYRPIAFSSHLISSFLYLSYSKRSFWSVQSSKTLHLGPSHSRFYPRVNHCNCSKAGI